MKRKAKDYLLEISAQEKRFGALYRQAAVAFARKGYLELQVMPEMRSRKQIVLTPDGEELARSTVRKMRTAEERALKAMGEEMMEQYIALHDAFLNQLYSEFEQKGIVTNL